jgi:hypothetical protein
LNFNHNACSVRPKKTTDRNSQPVSKSKWVFAGFTGSFKSHAGANGNPLPLLLAGDRGSSAPQDFEILDSYQRQCSKKIAERPAGKPPARENSRVCYKRSRPA